MSSISARAALTNFIATLQHGSLPLELTGKGPFLYFFYLLRQLPRQEREKNPVPGPFPAQLPRPGQLSTEASGGILRGRRRDERVTITFSRIFAHMYPQNR